MSAFLHDVEDDTAPEMLLPGGQPTDQAALEAALASGPVMASDFWDTKLVVSSPVYLPVEGSDLPLIYRGKSHAFIGEPGRGKSMLLQHLHVQEAAAGRCSLFIDLEKDFGHFRERIRALGATKETAARIGYWRLSGAITREKLEAIAAFTRQWGVEVVTIDSVGRALSRAGLTENDNDHVRRWFDETVTPMERGGLTVVLVDHMKKPDEGRGSRGGSPSAAGRYAKGAGAKLDVITGAAYGVSFTKPFSRSKPGMATLITAKDNNGSRHEGEIAAEVSVTPSDEGRCIEMVLRAVVQPINGAGEFRPTFYMQKVSEYLATAAEPVSISAIKRDLGGKSEWVGVAVERLVDEGFATQEPGPRGAKLIAHVRSFDQQLEGQEDGNPF